MTVFALATTVLLLPLLVAVPGVFVWRKGGAALSLFALLVHAVGFLGSLSVLATTLSSGLDASVTIPWLSFPGTKIALSVGVQLDGLGAVMFAIVQGLGLGVLVVSRWYLHGDRFYGRFFSSMSFFVFSMSGVVLAPGLLQAFICWELVGLGSYFLIGYWHDKPAASRDPEYQAGKPFHATGVDEDRLSPSYAQFKAFIVNRVGDFGFLSGLALCAWVVSSWSGFHGGDPLAWDTLFGAVAGGAFQTGTGLGSTGQALLTLAGILIFLGAMGKSAQFPFHVWLPDAMQGPTTASAIIHAATMVAAGVFLTARISPMLTPEALVFVQWVGAITALVAATIACVQWDYKAVLAYSTVSQLGYMMAGLGAGAAAGGFGAGTGHLFAHAIFKCLLFLGAAAVIHGLHGVQDLGRMGGLARKMPFTALATGAATLAILGVPGFSSFWSKDAILAATSAKTYLAAQAGTCIWTALLPHIMVTATAGLTAFYMSRQWILAFLGKSRDPHLADHAHDPDKPTIAVLLVLALLSLQAFWTGSVNPFASGSWLDAVVILPAKGLFAGGVPLLDGHLEHYLHVQTMIQTLVLLVLGVGAAFWLYFWNPSRGGHVAESLRRRPVTSMVWQFLANMWFVDRLWTVVGGFWVGIRGSKAVARADLGSGLSLDSAIDGAAGSSRLAGRFVNLFQGGRSGAYAGWTALVLFGLATLLLLF